MSLAAVLEGRERFHVEHCRAEDFERMLPPGSVHLMTQDQPYYGVKDARWDNAWPSPDAFLAWCAERLSAWRPILAPNGTLYVFASADMGGRVECVARREFEVLCNIRWKKAAGWSEKARKEELRAPFPASETVIFAEQRGSDSIALGESQYAAECDKLRGFVFEPLRAYLDGERERAGFGFDAVRAAVGCAAGSGLPSHWFTRSQWMLPTRENYEKLQRAFNANGPAEGRLHLRREYEDLRREYEDLRREYEDLRRPFSVSASVPYTDVWEYPTVQHYDGKHECEKPEQMALDIISASSRPGDIVADFFCGSGVFLAAAVKLGRRAIGCDASAHWAEFSRNRCAMAQATGRIEVRRVQRQDERQLRLAV